MIKTLLALTFIMSNLLCFGQDKQLFVNDTYTEYAICDDFSLVTYDSALTSQDYYYKKTYDDKATKYYIKDNNKVVIHDIELAKKQHFNIKLNKADSSTLKFEVILKNSVYHERIMRCSRDRTGAEAMEYSYINNIYYKGKLVYTKLSSTLSYTMKFDIQQQTQWLKNGANIWKDKATKYFYILYDYEMKKVKVLN